MIVVSHFFFINEDAFYFKIPQILKTWVIIILQFMECRIWLIGFWKTWKEALSVLIMELIGMSPVPVQELQKYIPQKMNCLGLM